MRVLFVLLLLLPPAVGAGADRNAEEARQLFQQANAHFAVGEFSQAAEKFMGAYKLKQDPALLFNAAQAARLAGDNERALVLYKNYLQFYPRSPNTDEVKSRIVQLQESIAATQRANTASPTPAPEQKDLGLTTPSPAAAVVVAPPRRKTPAYKKWWVWTIVAGAAVVVGASVATGVVLGTRRSGDSTRVLPELMPQ
jgi:tetratricopeptide (TPR) repeat protein